MTQIAEKYSRCISSSHLETKRWFEPSDLDIFIAAGTLQDSLGVGLLRLRAEFDRISRLPGARNMLPRLKSAGSVRARMLALVIDRGGNCGNEAIELVARLLDQWCDPNCPTCSGRGSIGAYGEPQHICTDCGGSKRRTLMWPEEIERFAGEIEDEMTSKVDSAARRIRKLLNQD